MTGEQITNAILGARYRRHFCIPRYTPENWWECDVFEITKAGFFREYEIKISLADFKADAGKSKDTWRYRAEPLTRTKYSEIGQPIGPSQFWYVAPDGILTPEIIPTWAGLILMSKASWRNQLIETEAKPAPKLHHQKCDTRITDHAKGVCYWRLLNLLTKAA